MFLKEPFLVVSESRKLKQTLTLLCFQFEMAGREVQTFLDDLLTNDGLMPSLEVVEKVSSVKIRKYSI